LQPTFISLREQRYHSESRQLNVNVEKSYPEKKKMFGRGETSESFPTAIRRRGGGGWRAAASRRRSVIAAWTNVVIKM